LPRRQIMPTDFSVVIGDRTVDHWATVRWEALIAHTFADWWRRVAETFPLAPEGLARYVALRKQIRYVALVKPVQMVLDQRAEALLKEKVLLKLMAARKRGEHLATVDEEEGRWQVDQPADGDDVSST